jgi:hypothetical protein
MSYQQGYPQQQYSGGTYSDETGGSGGNPALAIIAAVLGLVAAAALVVLDVTELKDFEGSIGDLPGEVLTILIGRAAGALFLLVGVILVFVRKVAGAILIAVGGLIGAAIILLYPTLLSDALGVTIGMGDYLELIFKFESTEATFSAIALIASPLALILSLLPPTLKYLRGRSGSSDYDDYPQQPGGGYPQTPGSGYPQQTPASGYQQQAPGSGYPQQGYPQQPQQPGW